MQFKPSLQRVVLFVAGLAVLNGCSAVGRMAVNRVGDGLTSGSSAFASDADPEFVLAAIPFGLKTYESLLEVSPKHPGLLRSAASGFAAYAFLLHQQVQLDDHADYLDRQRLDGRVSRLYLRARDYALRGLALSQPSLPSQLLQDPAAALAKTRKSDVPFLYWAGASWAGAISTAKDDPRLLAELPIAGALMSRALELDEQFDAGAIHEFFVTYEGSRPGGDVDAARAHYAKACELSHGNRASIHLALAESVSVRQQDTQEFRMLVQRALAVDPNSVAQWRVVNTLARQRATWLDAHVTDLFIDVQEN